MAQLSDAMPNTAQSAPSAELVTWLRCYFYSPWSSIAQTTASLTIHGIAGDCMELRDYQKYAIEALRTSLRTGHRTPVLQMSTGSGKTVVAGEIIKSATDKGKKVAFIVDRLTLVDQASAYLEAIGIDHGIIQGNHYMTDYAKDVQVISAQTLERRRPWEFDLALVDEAHCMRKSLMKLADKWNNIPFIGLSATPWAKGMGHHYDDLIIPITIHELIESGYLVDADAYGPSKPDMTGCKITGGDYNQKDAAKRADQDGLIADIVKTWKELAANRQTICFATNVAHSKHIAARFQAEGIIAEHIDAYTDSGDRRAILQAFKNGDIKLLTSVGVLTTGFDAPNAEVAILARPTKSLMLHIQMIGRILRNFPGKERGLILDHAGNIERLGFHTDEQPSHLDKTKKGEKKEPEKREKLPKTCPKCFRLIPPKISICPSCGLGLKTTNDIEEKKGELKELKKANREHTHHQKMEFYGGLKMYALRKGYKEGWAANKYREKYGVWPNAYNNAPLIEPNSEVMGFIQHSYIKYSKGRKKAIA